MTSTRLKLNSPWLASSHVVWTAILCPFHQGNSPWLLCLFHLQSLAVHDPIDSALSKELIFLNITFGRSENERYYTAQEDTDEISTLAPSWAEPRVLNQVKGYTIRGRASGVMFWTCSQRRMIFWADYSTVWPLVWDLPDSVQPELTFPVFL